MGTPLSLFDICPSCHLFLGLNLVEKEANYLGLVDVSVIWIHLDQWLNQAESAISQPNPIDIFKHLDEVLPIDHRLIDLLIILLKFGKHFVHLIFNAGLELGDRDRLTDGVDFFRNFWVGLDELGDLLFTFVLLGHLLTVFEILIRWLGCVLQIIIVVILILCRFTRLLIGVLFTGGRWSEVRH